MRPRQQRMLFIGAVAAAMVAAAAFAYRAFNENLLYYYSPTQIVDGEAPLDRRFRLGGIVVEGSFRQETGTLRAHFEVTDLANTVEVESNQVMPNLFQEGKGVVVHGAFDAHGLFVADDVLAKHDENYMAPEVKESLAESGAR